MLRRDGVFTGLALEPQTLRELQDIAERGEVRTHGPRKPPIPELRAPKLVGRDTIEAWNKSTPNPVVMGDVVAPEILPLVNRIAADPKLLEIVETYLGGAVKHVQAAIAVELRCHGERPLPRRELAHRNVPL